VKKLIINKAVSDVCLMPNEQFCQLYHGENNPYIDEVMLELNYLASSVPDEGYSRKTLYTLNLISTFLLIYRPNLVNLNSDKKVLKEIRICMVHHNSR